MSPTPDFSTAIPEELERPYLTAALPPIQGRARVEPEDFIVEEQPLYTPSGVGEHHYLFIEKRGIPTLEAVRRLARQLGCRDRDFGVAGLKDSHAITRQWVSIAGVAEARLSAFEDAQIKVLERSRHRNKLKKGHLAGNRFQLRIRECAAGDGGRARAVLERLAADGVPNHFGWQRFGQRLNSHRLGRALLDQDCDTFLGELLGRPGALDSPRIGEARSRYEQGDLAAALPLWPRSFTAERAALSSLRQHPGAEKRALRAIPRRFRLLYISALQSLLFNDYLARRQKLEPALEVGEVAIIERNKASFIVEHPEREEARRQSFEISSSGPIFGPRLLRPGEASACWQREQSVLSEHGLSLNSFANTQLGLRGQRRSLRFALRGISVEERDGNLELGFELGRGCYATNVLEELLRRPLR